MKIVVLGLWHQGSVAAACVSRFFPVVGLDFDPVAIGNLQRGRAPVFELHHRYFRRVLGRKRALGDVRHAGERQ